MKRIFFYLVCNTHFASQYVTVNIQGQLGNQMFQTAAAMAYAIDHHCEARFPTLLHAINAETNLKYVFHRLNTDAFPEETEFDFFYEPRYDLYAQIPYDAEKNISLFGYFPFEGYFSRYTDFIKALFAPPQEMLEEIYAKYGDILQHPTVAIHVRTFFPDSIDPNNGIGRINFDYFVNAIELFPEEYTFLVFSDSTDWTKLFFPRIRENLYIIEGNSHCFDFYLMSLCNHQIISPKSTFSWWAAWLNANPEKIVIRPNDQWLPDEAFPSSWRKIDIN